MSVISATLLYLGYTLLCVSIFLVLSLYLYFRHSFQYWNKRSVPHDEPIFPFGSLKSALNVNFGEFLEKIYRIKMKYHKYYGLWFCYRPCLFVNDPDLIKQILIKDSDSFYNRGVHYHKEAVPLSGKNVTTTTTTFVEEIFNSFYPLDSIFLYFNANQTFIQPYH